MTPQVKDMFVLLGTFQFKHMLLEPAAASEVTPQFETRMLSAMATWSISVFALILTDSLDSLPNLILPWALAAIDFGVRRVTDWFNSDRFKDSPTVQILRFLQIDHRVHHLTHYGIIYYLTQHGIRS